MHKGGMYNDDERHEYIFLANTHIEYSIVIEVLSHLSRLGGVFKILFPKLRITST